MARARGANAVCYGKFETTYGVDPGGNYNQLPFRNSSLSGMADLVDDDTLSGGRNPRDAQTDALDVNGDSSVPHDDIYMGYWLKGLLGDPVTAAALAATGSYDFSGQPAADSTIEVNGVTWTFKTSGAAGNQVDIGANLAATMTALALALNGSADADISVATYTGTATGLTIAYDALGPDGNAFTLAASADSNATPSGETLTGGANTHTFTSGSATLPSLALEYGNPEVPSYRQNLGVVVNSLKASFTRKGMAEATVNLIAQNELRSTVSNAGSPVAISDYNRFMNKSGGIRLDGTLIGELDSGDLTYSNNCETIEVVREDGLIAGADPAQISAKGTITVRFKDSTLDDKAVNETPVELVFGLSKGVGHAISYTLHRVHLARTKISQDGPAGLKRQFNYTASVDPDTGKVMTVVLTNAWPGY